MTSGPVGRIAFHQGQRVTIIDYHLVHVALRRADGTVYWAPIAEVTVEEKKPAGRA